MTEIEKVKYAIEFLRRRVKMADDCIRHFMYGERQAVNIAIQALQEKAERDKERENLYDIIQSQTIEIENMRDKLKEYENTGFTPEKIIEHEEMFKAYRHVCGGKSPEEIAKLQAENEQLKKLLLNLFKHGRSCKNCDNKPCSNYAECKDWVWKHADKLKDLGIEV